MQVKGDFDKIIILAGQCIQYMSGTVFTTSPFHAAYWPTLCVHLTGPKYSVNIIYEPQTLQIVLLKYLLFSQSPRQC